jgi:integrase
MRKYRSTFRQANGDPFPPQYVHPVIKRGVLHTYWRRGGHSETIKGAKLCAGRVVVLSQDWWDSYFALKHGGSQPKRDEEPSNNADPSRVIPKSWDALIADYKATNRGWLKMEPSTRSRYTTYLDIIGETLGKLNVAKTTRAIEPMITKKEFGDPRDPDSEPFPMGARQLRQAFSLLCGHAEKLGWIESNPVAKIAKPKTANPDGHDIWPDAEIAIWRETFPYQNADGTPCIPRRFLEMEIAWGARASDLLQLGWKDIKNGILGFTPRKTCKSTGKKVHLDATDQNLNNGEHLAAVLALCPKTETFFFQKPPRGFNQHTKDKIVALKAEPWSYTRLQKSVREWCGARYTNIGDDFSAHGLRKTFATMIAERTGKVLIVAAALGDTPESAMIYIKKRDERAASLEATRAKVAA